ELRPPQGRPLLGAGQLLALPALHAFFPPPDSGRLVGPLLAGRAARRRVLQSWRRWPTWCRRARGDRPRELFLLRARQATHQRHVAPGSTHRKAADLQGRALSACSPTSKAFRRRLKHGFRLAVGEARAPFPVALVRFRVEGGGRNRRYAHLGGEKAAKFEVVLDTHRSGVGDNEGGPFRLERPQRRFRQGSHQAPSLFSIARSKLL